MSGFAVDTSVVVAGLSMWHQDHEAALAALNEHEPRLPAHVLTESLAVLTRLPNHAVAPDVALGALLATFPQPVLSLSPRRHREALERAVAAGLAGGQLYDAMVGATASAHATVLLTADQRARRTYQAMDCEHRLV